MQNFDTILKEKGLKVTLQRVAILQQIYQKGHTTIEDIYANIHKDHPSISLATIYKNILALSEVEILREIKINAQKQRYEISTNNHPHLFCIKCETLNDLELHSTPILNHDAIPKDFVVSRIAVTLYGICPQCIKNKY